MKAVDRGRLNEDEICSQFVYILNDAPCLPKMPSVGILTADNRQKWAEVRESLCEVEQNRRNLDLISKSLLIVCFDEALPLSFNARSSRPGSSSGEQGWNRRAANGHNSNGRDEKNMMLQMIHGGGSSFNSANRWFDKTVQVCSF